MEFSTITSFHLRYILENFIFSVFNVSTPEKCYFSDLVLLPFQIKRAV